MNHSGSECCSEDFDDGYEKSDASSSYHSVCETLTDSKSTASSTSGLSSECTTSSSCQSENPSLEIVKKNSVGRKANDAIFKPGKRINCFCSCVIEMLVQKWAMSFQMKYVIRFQIIDCLFDVVVNQNTGHFRISWTLTIWKSTRKKLGMTSNFERFSIWAQQL